MGLKYRANPDRSLVLYRDRPRLPLNGVGRLPAALTVNAITEYPVLRYTAGGGMVNAGATVWSPWGYGEDLAVVPVGVAPTPRNGSPGLGVLDDSVKFNASDYFAAAGNAFADITTEDFVVEAVFRMSVTNGITFFGKTTAAKGFVLYESGDTVRVFIGDATGNVSVFSAVLIDKTFYHLIVFMDRSGSGQVYIDGAPSGAPVVISARAASLTIASPFGIGKAGAVATADNAHSYCAMWKRDAWLDTHLQPTIAEQRASLFWGWRPQMARGTAVPTVRTRASGAYLDKREGAIRKLYLVGQNVPRCVDRLDKNGAKLRGYLPEVQITNLCLRSEEINDAAWTKNRCSITNTSITNLPNGAVSVNDVIHEDGTAASSHYIGTTALISFTVATKYIWSVWAKPLNRNWAYLYLNNNGVACTAYFNLTTGASGTVGNFSSYGIEPWGNGWYRCWVGWTHGITEDRSPSFFIAQGNGVYTFNGLDQDSLYFWGAQVEAGVDYPSSYMPTAAAAVIREEDILRYAGADGNLGGVGSNRRGQIKLKMLCENYDAAVAKRLITLSDGGSGADLLYLRSAASDVLHAESIATEYGGGAWTGTSDVIDGAVHAIELPYEVGQLGPGRVDGVAEDVADTGHGIADELDRIDVGVDESGTTQPNAVVADIELFPRMMRV